MIQNKTQLRDHAPASASFNEVSPVFLCSLAGLPPGAGIPGYPFPSKGDLAARRLQVGMNQAG